MTNNPAGMPQPPGLSAPVQVHLALGHTVSTMSVAWSTYDRSAPAAGSVEWSATEDMAKISTNPADMRPFTMDAGRTWYTHTANMTGLSPLTRYWYRVRSASNESSKVFSFETMPDVSTLPTSLPELHLIYGDMGASDAFTLCSACTGHSHVCDVSTCATANQSAGLIAEVAGTTAEGIRAKHIVHTGDFAYNLQDGGGTVGDQFMVNIEQVAANIPYMVSVGNHENSAGNLAHFTERFRHMPSNSGTVSTANKPSDAANNWYFSWDAGLVHYIAISTELYFGVKSTNPDDDGSLAKQFAWLEADLEKAQLNRKNVPWIVIHGHRSIYCSCDGDCDGAANTVRDGVDGKYGMEDLMFKHGVDFFINGHEHDYERSWPVYKSKSDQSNVDPKGTIYVVTGAAGSSELHEPFTRQQPEWSAYRSNTFGYSRMHIHNNTHLHWQQVQTDPTLFGPGLYGRVIDDAWVVQHNHGPFDATDAPSGKCPAAGCGPGVSYDHWLPLLNLTAAEVGNTGHAGTLFAGKEYELIEKYRQLNGGM